MSGLYVYAFVAGGKKPARIAGHSIEVVEAAGIHLAVERLERPPRLSEATLRTQHAIVTRLGRRFDAIVPVRFGAFVKREELERIVRARRRALVRGLKRVQGRVQMTTRVFAPAEMNETIRRRPSSGIAYLEERKASAATPSPAVKALRAAAAPYSVDERVERGRTRGATTLFHLIARGDAGSYRTKVRQTAATFEQAVAVTVTGPWPPFAFVTELCA